MKVATTVWRQANLIIKAGYEIEKNKWKSVHRVYIVTFIQNLIKWSFKSFYTVSEENVILFFFWCEISVLLCLRY